MKTTVDLPDKLYQIVRSHAKRQKKSFREILIEALKRIIVEADQHHYGPLWTQYFGAFSGSKKETKTIQAIIDAELSLINKDEWQ